MKAGRDETDHYAYYLTTSKELTPVAKAVSAAPAVADGSITVALNSLKKRLGDLHVMTNPDATMGTWARTYFKSMTVKDVSSTDMNVAGMEAGFDYKLDNITTYYDDISVYLGFMAGAMTVSDIKGSGKNAAKGNGTGFLGGVYTTFLAESGLFMDFTARGGTNKTNITAYSQSEEKWIDFSPERPFVAVSVEAGKLLDYRVRNSGWLLEPKAEIQYINIQSTDTDIDSGFGKVSFGGASYTTIAAAFNASHSFTMSEGRMLVPFGEIAYSVETSGTEKVTYAGETGKSSMKGGTFELRAGVNMQINDNLYWHAALDLESGKKKKSLGAAAGIRYMFGGLSGD